ETAPVCASLVPSRLDALVAVALNDTRLVAAIGAILILSVMALSLGVRTLQKRLSRSVQEKRELEQTVLSISMV
ncbi:hypothetical protein KIPB_012796, partial [Kipferlia bialata]